MDVNLRGFSSRRRRPAVTTGNFLQKRGMDEIDYKKTVVKYISIYILIHGCRLVTTLFQPQGDR
jgi:hypothetical protein